MRRTNNNLKGLPGGRRTPGRPLPKTIVITRSRRLATLACPVCQARFAGLTIPRHGRSGEPPCSYETPQKLTHRLDD